MLMFNVEGFCKEGLYIPFWICEEYNFILLYHYGKIIYPCVYSQKTCTIQSSNKYREIFRKEVENLMLKTHVDFTDDYKFLINEPWSAIKEKLSNNSKCCFYNLTKGEIIEIYNEYDAEKLISLVCKQEKNNSLENRIRTLLTNTLYMQILYKKYTH